MFNDTAKNSMLPSIVLTAEAVLKAEATFCAAYHATACKMTSECSTYTVPADWTRTDEGSPRAQCIYLKGRLSRSRDYLSLFNQLPVYRRRQNW